MTILKNAVSFYEEGQLASLLSVIVSTNEVIAAGLSLFQHIYGDKTKALETLSFLSYSRMKAKKKLNPSKGYHQKHHLQLNIYITILSSVP